MAVLTRDLRAEAKKFEAKLKNIKVFLCDVDGILTNGYIYYAGNEIGFNRYFHALDGYGLKTLNRAGIKVGIVTGGDSVGVKKRAHDLKLDYSFVGNEDKRGHLSLLWPMVTKQKKFFIWEMSCLICHS